MYKGPGSGLATVLLASSASGDPVRETSDAPNHHQLRGLSGSGAQSGFGGWALGNWRAFGGCGMWDAKEKWH